MDQQERNMTKLSNLINMIERTNVKEAGTANDINSTYRKIACKNTCRFKCAYYTPYISSKWMEETRQYKTNQQEINHKWQLNAII